MVMSSKPRWLSIGQYQNNHRFAKESLGNALFRGELVLFLGAGVSAPFGLPTWSALLSDCATELGITLNPKEILTKKGALRVASLIKHKAGSTETYLKLITSKLYRGHSRFAPTPLLSSISAMLSGSARGRVSTVVTLNFDDLLETFLLLGGYDCQVIKSWPTLTRSADVSIFHPHGFLPKPAGIASHFFTSSSSITFSKDEFGSILSKRSSEWRRAIGSIIRQKVVLAIGLGPGEPHIRSLFREASSEVTDRPLGFWVGKKPLPGRQMSVRDKLFFEQCKIAPIMLDDYEPDYPMFIQGICQSAARCFKSRL